MNDFDEIDELQKWRNQCILTQIYVLHTHIYFCNKKTFLDLYFVITIFLELIYQQSKILGMVWQQGYYVMGQKGKPACSYGMVEWITNMCVVLPMSE